eukprot:6182976-Pleurochrysis_carterae.AAC.1
MRHALPSESFGSKPAPVAIAWARRLESAADHGDAPSTPVNSGVRLGVPNVRSCTGTLSARSSHVILKASNAHRGSTPRAPPLWRRRRGIGVAFLRTAVSLIGTTCTRAHSWPSLTADGCIHCTEAHVRSRDGSNSRSVGCLTSPARSSRLCASRIAVHSIRARAESPQPPARAIAWKFCAQKPLLSLRVPVGGSSLRMRLNAMARAPPPPGLFRRDLPPRFARPQHAHRSNVRRYCVQLQDRARPLIARELARRINSAKSTCVSTLYAAPPDVDGSTNGTRSVELE